ncbi:MAG: SDR family oxidoreductase [Myxococcaceae bacterium]
MSDMTGRTVLVTGATAGIGKQTAIGIAQQGARVVIVGRNPEKTKGVVEEIKTRTSNQQVESMICDLSSLAQVRQLAADFKAKYGKLDVLVNNAGAMNPSRKVTADGYELTFGLNHLTYFLLTELLLPALEAAGTPERKARIVSVASEAHRSGKLNFDDLNGEKSWSGWGSYGTSKLANILWTRELSRRLNGKNVTANCLHPGFVASDFLSKGGIWTVIKPIAYLFAIDEVEGAQTSIYLATSPEVEGKTGDYYARSRLKAPRKSGQDDAVAKQLWEASEKLVAPSAAKQAA